MFSFANFKRPKGLTLIALYKVAWGVVEILTGISVAYSTVYFRREIIEDPQDLLVQWFLNHAHLQALLTWHVGLLLVIFGLSKIVIGVGLWLESWRARRIVSACLAAFATFAVVDIAVHFSWFKFFALAFEAAFIVYLYFILPPHKDVDLGF